MTPEPEQAIDYMRSRILWLEVQLQRRSEEIDRLRRERDELRRELVDARTEAFASKTERNQARVISGRLTDQCDELRREHLRQACVCEHGVADGDWCESCNTEYKRARQAGLDGDNKDDHA